MNIHPDLLKSLRAYYTPGSRVMLVYMDDPYAKLKPGERGTVAHVDDAGTVHVNWDCGSTLGIVFAIDECRIIEEESE